MLNKVAMVRQSLLLVVTTYQSPLETYATSCARHVATRIPGVVLAGSLSVFTLTEWVQQKSTFLSLTALQPRERLPRSAYTRHIKWVTDTGFRTVRKHAHEAFITPSLSLTHSHCHSLIHTVNVTHWASTLHLGCHSVPQRGKEYMPDNTVATPQHCLHVQISTHSIKCFHTHVYNVVYKLAPVDKQRSLSTKSTSSSVSTVAEL